MTRVAHAAHGKWEKVVLAECRKWGVSGVVLYSINFKSDSTHAIFKRSITAVSKRLGRCRCFLGCNWAELQARLGLHYLNAS